MRASLRSGPPGVFTMADPGVHDDRNPQKLHQLQVAAGLEKSGPHRLRHTGLTILAAKGTNPYKLQKHARHAKLETTQGYVHLAAEQAAREAAAMWGDAAPVAGGPTIGGHRPDGCH